MRYPVLYGVFQGASMFAGAFGSLLMGAFKDWNGDYRVGLIVFAGIAIVGMLLVFCAMAKAKQTEVKA